MPITGYTRPQLLIRQVLEVIPDNEERTLNAFVPGPQFSLHRYTNAAERAEMVGTTFIENADPDPAARQLVPYEGVESTQVVDQAFTRLYAEKLEGQILTANSSVLPADPELYDFVLPSLLTPNRIKVVRRKAVITATQGTVGSDGVIVSASLIFGGSGYAPSTTIDQPVVGGGGTGAVIRMTTSVSGSVVSVSVVGAGTGYTSSVTFVSTAPNAGVNVGHVPDAVDSTPLLSDLRGRPIKAGDVVYATYDGVTTRRIVQDVLREALDAHFGTDAGKADKKFAAASTNPTQVAASSYGNTAAPVNWQTRLMYGSIAEAYVADPGSGYLAPPTVTISPPISIDSGGYQIPGAQAVVSAVLNDAGEVASLNVDNCGAGYYWGGIVGIIINNGGSGYSAANPPRIVLTGGTGGYLPTAELEPVIAGGAITGVKILEPGHGYGSKGNFGTLTGLSLVGGVGSGAEIIAVANNGGVRSLTITDHGTGYDADVTVTMPTAGAGFAAKAWFGANSAVIDTAGTGYVANEVVELNVTSPTLKNGRKTRVRVVTVDGVGAVTAVEVVAGYEGWYDGTDTLPGLATPTTSLTGSGTNLTLDIDLGIWLIDILNPGVLYEDGDAVVFTASGAGAGAAADAEVLSFPTITMTGAATGTLFYHSHPDFWNGIIEGSTYDGKYAERYTLTVTTAGSGQTEARVRVRSASGAFSANNAIAYHYGRDYVIKDPALGGLQITLRPPVATTPLNLGDVFTFVVGGKYTPLDLGAGGKMIDLDVLNAGTGYTDGTKYDLVISPPAAGGVQATAQIDVVGTSVDATTLVITNPGSGYLAPPTVALPAAAGAGTGAILEGVISLPETDRDLTVVQSGVYTGPRDTRYQVKVIQGTMNYYTEDSFNGAVVRVSDSSGVDTVQEYTITQGAQYDLGTYGLKFIFPAGLPSPSSGPSLIAATADSEVSGGSVSRIVITNPGDGYVTPPTVYIVGVGSNAAAEAVIADGKVVSIVVTNPGSGYGMVEPIVMITAPQGYQPGLRTGDTYYIDAVASANVGPYSTINLYGQATDITGWTESDLAVNKFDIDVRTLFTGLLEQRRQDPPNLGWEAGTTTDGGVLLTYGLRINVVGRDPGYEWVPVKNGLQSKLFAHWRALVPATSGDTIRLYQSEEEIVAAFGTKDMDNPVCYGACMAFLGGQEKPIFVARLASDDVAGHTAMIRQAEHVDGIYSIGLTTYDRTIHDLWANHVNKMSLENQKLWRRVYVATQNPGPYVSMATKSDGTDYTATVTTNASGNVRVVCSDGDFVTRGILPGDLYRTNYAYDAWGDPTYEEYVVYTVNSEDELILLTGPAAPVNPAVKFEIWRPDNGLSQAQYAGERSDAFMNRRVINVWCDSPYMTDADSNILQVPVYYLACEAAGLRAAVLPQQGLTYTELDYSLDAAPLMFTKYSEEELNTAAAMGTWIVTQEREDGPIFIRHQLTTATNRGILYYEDSIGANVDNISYATKDIFQPYVGRRNANQETLEEMETKWRDLLDGYKKNPGGFTNIGPALITWRDMSITIDPVFKDRINAVVTLELPLPINTIIVTLRATTASDETIATINATVNAPAAV